MFGTSWIYKRPGPRFKLMTVFPGRKTSYHLLMFLKMTVVIPSYRYNGNSYTGKTAPKYANGAHATIKIPKYVTSGGEKIKVLNNKKYDGL